MASRYGSVNGSYLHSLMGGPVTNGISFSTMTNDDDDDGDDDINNMIILLDFFLLCSC